MRNLLDLIFSNLIPIIIVVSVAIRIIAGVKNAARRRGAVPGRGGNNEDDRDDGEDVADVWSRLKPDDDDEGERRVPSPAGLSRPLPAQAPPPRPPAISVTPAIVQPLIAEEPGEPDTDRLAAGKPDAKNPAPGPLDRLNKLPPLRRAVIFAEILGSPKALD
jgi:hypothetical protein